jgi:preprotein translocase subunit SecA
MWQSLNEFLQLIVFCHHYNSHDQDYMHRNLKDMKNKGKKEAVDFSRHGIMSITCLFC